MVKLVAQKAVDTTNLTELGLFGKYTFKQLNRKHEGKTFDVSKGDVDIHADGRGMLFILKKPVSGTVESLTVKTSGSQAYKVSDLDIKLRKMDDTFKGSFASSFFSDADTMTGSNKADTLFGYAGNDKLFGKDGADVIKGGRGDDLLDGGDGKDTLTGGQGVDRFQFKSQLDPSNVDTITDFTPGQDKILLGNASFPGIGAKGKLAQSAFILESDYSGEDHVIIYDKPEGTLSYSVNGGAIGNAVEFASVTENLGLSYKDFLIV